MAHKHWIDGQRRDDAKIAARLGTLCRSLGSFVDNDISSRMEREDLNELIAMLLKMRQLQSKYQR